MITFIGKSRLGDRETVRENQLLPVEIEIAVEAEIYVLVIVVLICFEIQSVEQHPVTESVIYRLERIVVHWLPALRTGFPALYLEDIVRIHGRYVDVV